MTREITAILLAAGESRRMGQPKMLLPWGDTTVLGQVVKMFSAGLSQRTNLKLDSDIEILVVTGGARSMVEAEVARLAEKYPLRRYAEFHPGWTAGTRVRNTRRADRSRRPTAGPGRDSQSHLHCLFSNKIAPGHSQFPEPPRPSLAGQKPFMARSPGTPAICQPAAVPGCTRHENRVRCSRRKHSAGPGHTGRVQSPTAIDPFWKKKKQPSVCVSKRR